MWSGMFNRSRFCPVWFCSLTEKNGNQSINQLFNEGQVDLVGGGHHVVGDVEQVQILPRLVLQPE